MYENIFKTFNSYCFYYYLRFEFSINRLTMSLLFNFIILILFYSHELQTTKSSNIIKPFQNVKNFSEKLIIVKLNRTFMGTNKSELDLRIHENNTFSLNNDSTFKNGTDVHGHVALVILKCIFLSIMILLIIIGNTLVILTVLIVKKLHTKDNANNLLIVSLSISDLLVGVLVLPLALYIEVKEGHK